MKYKKSRRNNRRFPYYFLIGILLTALLTSGALLAAWVTEQQAGSPGQTQTASGKKPKTDKQDSKETTAPETSQTEETTTAPPEPFQALVDKNDAVDNAYFDDAVFIGDSLTTGIALYGVMDNTTVYASKSLNLHSVYTEPAVTIGEKQLPIMDAVKEKHFQKVYVMLGSNEIRDEDQEVFLKRYQALLDDLRASQPDAIIYVQSILPVTRNNRYNMDNTRIDTFNEALLDLCNSTYANTNLYYVNVAEAFKDENGMLPEEASPVDGMHFGTQYYEEWFSYLRGHTVSEDEAEDK